MDREHIMQAAALLWRLWEEGQRMTALPAALRPADRAQAYAIQAAVAQLSGQPLFGWKIAATSLAGQQHIGVDGPLAGRLLQGRVRGPGAAVPVQHHGMRVAEAEFAFRMAEALPPRPQPYTVQEVMAAVESAHPAIEMPDARYHDFVRVGAPQLIADNACACWFVLGEAITAPWRTHDLVQHQVSMQRNGVRAATGSGAQVLGDPRLALTWLANEVSVYGPGLQAGQVVTTGTCLQPVAIAPGDHVVADFGAFGQVEASVV